MPSFQDTMQMLRNAAADYRTGTDRAAEYDKQALGLKMREQLGSQVQQGAPIQDQMSTMAQIDPEMYSKILQARFTAQTKADSGTTLDPSAVDTLGGLTPEQRATAKRYTGKQQADYLSTVTKDAGVIRGQEGIGLGHESQERLKETATYNKANDFKKDLNKIQGSIRERDESYAAVKQAIDRGEQPDFAIVFNFVARKEAGEKGPLSNDDIKRLADSVFSGSVTAAQNFLSGDTTIKLSPQQKAAFTNIVMGSAKRWEGVKDRTMAEFLTNAARVSPELYDPGSGKTHPVLQGAVEDSGFEFDTAKPGVPRVRKHVATRKFDLSKMKEEERSKAQKLLDRYSGQSIPQEVIDAIKDAGGDVQ